MGYCIVCKNAYKDTLNINYKGVLYTFDSFECAIQQLAPLCQNCGIRIIGHGVEENGRVFCCNHCMQVFEGSVPQKLSG